MNYKIIETDNKYPDVLLYRGRDGDGRNFVNILAIGKMNNDETDSIQGEEIIFNDPDVAKMYIDDFSVKSANQWCEDLGIKYEKK